MTTGLERLVTEMNVETFQIDASCFFLLDAVLGFCCEQGGLVSNFYQQLRLEIISITLFIHQLS